MTTERNAQGVDVLAVMDWSTKMFRELSDKSGGVDHNLDVEDAERARAAVAELIAEARALHRLILSLQAGNSVPFGTLDNAARRLDAALTNIEGGKA